ncbi:segregation/condensation protein A [Streptomyces sp. NPDC056222]|uniref:segregation/condensation protein A n=1 Tax=Streptomyces sp. NPDC056222 TaxID=3345749 RepID=UPI0035DF07CD
MPPPPDETSRPARRRALGRGPGTPRTAPAAPEAAQRSVPAVTPEAEPQPAPAGASTAPEAGSGADTARQVASATAGAAAPPAADAAEGKRPGDGPQAPAAETDPGSSLSEGESGLGAVSASAGPDTVRQPGSGPGGTDPGSSALVGDGGLRDAGAVVEAVVTASEATAPVVDPAGSAGARRSVAVPGGEADILRGLGSDAPAGAGDSVVDPAETRPGDGAAAPEPVAAPPRDGGDDGRFTVRLANFEGPFDLLLQLISKHKLDVTEVALSKVTDEFMAHIRAMGPDWDLDQTTEFLVVAATLLDLKAARLLPAAEVEDEADLALLEARDLLFARLLQYRAYKQIATIFEDRWETEGRRYPRTVGLEAHHAELLPEVVISIGAEGFAKLAVKAMQPRAKPQVYVDHIHAPLVSVREQAGIVVALLRERGSVSFRELADGADDTLTVVARFLALLELYREKAVALDQEDALGELTVTWTGGDQETHVTDEFDHEVEEKA